MPGDCSTGGDFFERPRRWEMRLQRKKILQPHSPPSPSSPRSRQSGSGMGDRKARIACVPTGGCDVDQGRAVRRRSDSQKPPTYTTSSGHDQNKRTVFPSEGGEE